MRSAQGCVRLRVRFAPGRIWAQCSVEKIRFETGGKKKKVMKRKTYLVRVRVGARVRARVRARMRVGIRDRVGVMRRS